MNPNELTEPEIIINGILMSDSSAMTIRVALESFAMTLNEEGLGEDEIGKKIAINYKANISAIRQAIFLNNKT